MPKHPNAHQQHASVDNNAKTSSASRDQHTDKNPSPSVNRSDSNNHTDTNQQNTKASTYDGQPAVEDTASQEHKPGQQAGKTEKQTHKHDMATQLTSQDKLAKDPHYVAMGKIGRTHGLKGMVFIQSFTEPKENLFTYSPLTLGNQTPIAFSKHQTHGKQCIAQIEGYNDCDSVRTFINQTIYLHQSHLPALAQGQYYWHQLHGCQVINQDGFIYGKLDYIYEGAQFPIMVIKHPTDHRKPEALIPYEPSVVQSIDLQQASIYVDWTTDT